MDNKRKIRVRFAPSPTGLFTMGNARTALFNYLFAKKNKGKFILRIEDTDIERSEKKYEKDIIESLKWLGLDWDEGPIYQSERTEIYQQYIKKLLDSGQAFYCDHTKKELEKEKKEQIDKKQAPRHRCNRKGKTEKGIIRFRCPDKKVVFDDLIRGKLEFNGSLLGDISIAKDKQTPLYNFTAAIDDAEMQISHVIRGEDHISNTPKQILIQEALELKSSQFAHLPLILGPDKSKMSKRHGAISVGEYQKQGYLSEALVNFMVLLGWNPGTEKEIFNLEELIKEFSLERVHKGGAIFNLQRLDWINGQYIKNMDTNELTEKCLPYLPKGTELKFAKKVVALEKERIKKLSEIGELTKFFFNDELEYDPELLIWKKMSLKEVKNNLEILEKKLSKTEDFDQKSLEDLMIPLREKYGTGELLWPLRVALSGQSNSPGPFEIMEILGKEKTLKRIKKAIKKVSL
ncbi:glutamate--tRNA ligase [Patescibacteria group bacterium]|nr:glutamate--tRNA ligase [Patescibacteria group bacterium]